MDSLDIRRAALPAYGLNDRFGMLGCLLGVAVSMFLHWNSCRHQRQEGRTPLEQALEKIRYCEEAHPYKPPVRVHLFWRAAYWNAAFFRFSMLCFEAIRWHRKSNFLNRRGILVDVVRG